MHLSNRVRISQPYVRYMERERKTSTVHSLEATAWWGVDVITIGTEQLHCVQSWQIRPPARDNVAPNTIYTWTETKYTPFVFCDLAAIKREGQLPC